MTRYVVCKGRERQMFKNGDELVLETISHSIEDYGRVLGRATCRFVKYLSEHEMRESDADMKVTGMYDVDPRNTCEVVIMDSEFDHLLYHLLVNPDRLSYPE